MCINVCGCVNLCVQRHVCIVCTSHISLNDTYTICMSHTSLTSCCILEEAKPVNVLHCIGILTFVVNHKL